MYVCMHVGMYVCIDGGREGRTDRQTDRHHTVTNLSLLMWLVSHPALYCCVHASTESCFNKQIWHMVFPSGFDLLLPYNQLVY